MLLAIKIWALFIALVWSAVAMQEKIAPADTDLKGSILAQKPGPEGTAPVAFAYVAETNGYIFMLLGTEQPPPLPGSKPELQSAIENIKLSGSKQ